MNNIIFFIIGTVSSRNEFLPLEMDKIQGEVVHPYLHLQVGVK
jgi:hypothetical protein